MSAILAVGAPAPVVAGDVLTLCYERKDARPWRTTGGEGLDFTLLREVARRLDMRLEFVGLPWKRCLAKLQVNEVNGAFSVAYNQERARFSVYPGGALVDESKRMHSSSYFLLRRKGSAVGWDGHHFTGLDGPVGFQLGYSIGEDLHALGVPVDEVNYTPQELVRLLLAGRVGAIAVFDTDVGRIMQSPLADQVEVLRTPLADKPYYLVLSRAIVAAQPQLTSRLWAMVEEVRNSPTYIRQRHEAGVGD